MHSKHQISEPEGARPNGTPEGPHAAGSILPLAIRWVKQEVAKLPSVFPSMHAVRHRYEFRRWPSYSSFLLLPSCPACPPFSLVGEAIVWQAGRGESTYKVSIYDRGGRRSMAGKKERTHAWRWICEVQEGVGPPGPRNMRLSFGGIPFPKQRWNNWLAGTESIPFVPSRLILKFDCCVRQKKEG